MKIGIISEGKYDSESLSLIITKIINNKIDIEFETAFGSGKSDIIRSKKLFSNKLHNQKCDYVFIVRDSDGADTDRICRDIKAAYDSTQIAAKYDVILAVQELEAWYLTDSACISSMYDSVGGVAYTFTQCTDGVNSPKEELRRFVENESKNEDVYLESDSPRLAEFLDIEVATSNSVSFREFREKIESTISTPVS